MPTTQPSVSIITPVYRSEDILARAIGSLLAQDHRDWEAILVDDGSPENSWRVVQAYSWIDSRIRPIRQPHAGACIARNTGIAQAQGEYLLFLDADDWMETDALSAMVNACEANRWEAAHAGLRYVTPEGSPTLWQGGYSGNAELFDALAGSNVLSVPSSAILRRSIIDEIGAFDPSLVHCGDWDLWARLARHDGAVGRVNQTVTNYRMRPGSLSRSPRTLLRDAVHTLRRIHAPDRRVRRPKAALAHGADPAQLLTRINHFAIYAAALAICGGGFEAAKDVLELVPQWTRVSGRRAGEFAFYAMCFAHCCGPERVAEFWPDVVAPLHALIAELQRLTSDPALGQRMFEAMEDCLDQPIESLPLPLPEPVSPGDEEEQSQPAPTTYDTLAHDLLRSLAR